MQAEAIPYLTPRAFISLEIVSDNLVPVAPNGCPIAMAPSFTLQISLFKPSYFSQPIN